MRSSPALGFPLFYLVLPWLLTVWANHNKAKMIGALASTWSKLMDAVFLRRFIHPSEWAGIAIPVVCMFIGVWKLATTRSLSHQGERKASLLSRVISRLLG